MNQTGRRERRVFAKKRAHAQIIPMGPQTLYGLADSPAALEARHVDHAVGGGNHLGVARAQRRNDDITLCWMTDPEVSTGRRYLENKLNLYKAEPLDLASTFKQR